MMWRREHASEEPGEARSGSTASTIRRAEQAGCVTTPLGSMSHGLLLSGHAQRGSFFREVPVDGGKRMHSSLRASVLALGARASYFSVLVWSSHVPLLGIWTPAI